MKFEIQAGCFHVTAKTNLKDKDQVIKMAAAMAEEFEGGPGCEVEEEFGDDGLVEFYISHSYPDAHYTQKELKDHYKWLKNNLK